MHAGFRGDGVGKPETLNLIQKGTKLKDYLRLVAISRDVGLPLRFSMIVGFPDESEKSVNDTLDLIETLGEEPFIFGERPKAFYSLSSGLLNTTSRCGEA